MSVRCQQDLLFSSQTFPFFGSVHRTFPVSASHFSESDLPIFLGQSFPLFQVSPSHFSSQSFPFFPVSPSNFSKLVLFIFQVSPSHFFGSVIPTFPSQTFPFLGVGSSYFFGSVLPTFPSESFSFF